MPVVFPDRTPPGPLVLASMPDTAKRIDPACKELYMSGKRVKILAISLHVGRSVYAHMKSLRGFVPMPGPVNRRGLTYVHLEGSHG